MQAQRVCRSIAVLFLNVSARQVWVVSATLRPLCRGERDPPLSLEAWVVPRADLDLCGEEKISCYSLVCISHTK